jgi:ribosomal protein S18 acetylase RimI-like enzyme
MSTVVSYAKPADAEALAALFAAVVAPLDMYNEVARAVELAKFTAADFARLIAEDPSSVIVAWLDGRASGFAITYDEHGPIWLEWYGVAPEARGYGLGEQLLRFVLADAKRRGATRVWCDTLTSNATSIALLEKLGFNLLCLLPNHWHRQDYYLWEFSPL